MPYEYLNHQADMGIRGIGATVEEAFSEGAQALFAAIADVDTVRPSKEFPLYCTAPDIPSLFVEWLNELLYRREVNDVLFASACITRLEREGQGWVLDGIAQGEPLDPERHELRTEVKAATYYGLEYRVEQGRHIIQCVVDV